ncbi:MAG: transporter [Methylocella sp.]
MRMPLDGERSGLLLRFQTLAWLVGVIVTASAAGAIAGSQDGSAEQASISQSANGQEESPDSNVDNNGHDITRPQNSLEWRSRFESSLTDASRTDRVSTMLRLSRKLNLDDGWRLAALVQVPFVARTKTTFDSPSQQYNAGIGDAFVQGILSHAINERMAFGFGARLIAPTAAENLGSEKWQIAPGFGFRYLLPELGADGSFVPAMRYAISFAGSPYARRISEPQIAPTLNIDLPGPLFVTFYPSNDIRINYGAPVSGQTGRLFLPFDALVGAKLTNTLQVSLEVGVPIVKDYPVYNFKTELRVRVLY